MALTKCELSKSFLRYRGEIGTVPQVHKIAWSDFEVAAQRPARRVDRQLLLHCLHHIPVTKHMDVRVTNTPGANWRRAQRGPKAALAHPVLRGTCASLRNGPRAGWPLSHILVLRGTGASMHIARAKSCPRDHFS